MLSSPRGLVTGWAQGARDSMAAHAATRCSMLLTRIRLLCVATVALTSFLTCVGAAAQEATARPAVAETRHSSAFWYSLKEAQFKLGPDESAAVLASEATVLLSSTDPEMRDGIGYEAIAAWVYRDQLLSGPQLQRLQAQLMRNAVNGLGRTDDDSLFGRSFSILALSVLAAEDLKQPYLTETQYAELLNLGIQSLERERDLRAYVPGKGWGHATAHTADLLKFLARNKKLEQGNQRRIVEAVVTRLRSAGIVFVWGEDARLASTLASIARRADADAASFSRWFVDMRAAHSRLWEGRFDTASYVAERAQLNALAQLSLNLDSDKTAPGSPEIRELMRIASQELR
jgi:hypothetical protein